MSSSGIKDALFDGYRLRPAAEFTQEYRTSREGEQIRENVGIRRPRPGGAPTPPPPVIEDADARRQDESDRVRLRRGRASAMLTNGNAGRPLTAGKYTLGG